MDVPEDSNISDFEGEGDDEAMCTSLLWTLVDRTIQTSSLSDSTLNQLCCDI